jgi:(E)-4-hydroxy-3-methyl-but-2-enyl pyrophosphate reductase
MDMKILITKNSGFCMGVRRAVEMVLDATTEYPNPIFTYGPLIHNPQVLKLLEDKGIHTLNEVPDHGSGTILIRAHGIPPQTKQKLQTAGFNVLDATCPRVIKIQNIIKKYAKENYASIIIGDDNHPEVIGLLGYAGEKKHVIGKVEELQALPAYEKAIVVAQTTQNTQLLEKVRSRVERDFPHYKFFDTICDSTEKRQAELKRLTRSVDAVIVVGGRNSGNTRRLVEIVEQSGKPAFHIETEAEVEALDLDTLTSSGRIGITAGASTPNWLIKKVFRVLESRPFKGRLGWYGTLFKAQRFLLLTDIYLSLGAGCLSFACTRLFGMPPSWPLIFICMLYVQSMHTLNRLIGNRADEYNDPERAVFYLKYRLFLTIFAVATGATGLIVAYTLGTWPFLALLAMSILGWCYNLKLIPEKFSRFRCRKIRDIPGSKTFLIAMAWGILTAILPALSIDAEISWANGLIFVWASGLVFIRTAFFDILDMQGDRIAGRETIALLLGEKKSMMVLTILLLMLMIILPLSAALGVVTSLGFGLILCSIFLLIILSAYQRGLLLPSIKMEFLIETQFIGAGLIALLWHH